MNSPEKTESALLKLLQTLNQQMVPVPAGVFSMGSSQAEVDRCVEFWTSRLVDKKFTAAQFRQWILKEYPCHPVQLNSFSLSRFPITNQQYRDYITATGAAAPESIQRNKPQNHPVWGVSLDAVQGFLDWLSIASGKVFRLPTEAEWEYAAKGPQSLEYPFGEEFDSAKCNTVEAGIGDTTPVTDYARFASGFDICDLAGNVEEWTSDCYSPYQGGTLVKDDLVDTLGTNYPITRGGSFKRGGDLARSARRHGPYPAPEYKFIGFRVAISAMDTHK